MVGLGDLNASALLDALDDVFVAFDATGTVRVWNRTALAVTGYTESKLATMKPTDLFAGEDADIVTAAIAELYGTGSAVLEADLVTADQGRIPYEFKAYRLPGEEKLAFAGFGRDISVRRESERERDAILNRMGDAFFALDSDWRIVYVNAEGERILADAMGRDRRETTFEGRNLWEEIPDAVDTTFFEKYHEAMNTGETVSFEEYFAPLDAWFDVRAFPSATGLSVYFHDVTERRRQRDRLEHRERVLKELYTITADRRSCFTRQIEALLELGRAELDTEYGTLSAIHGDEYRFEAVDADDGSINAGDVVPLDATNCELAATNEETLVLGDIARDAPDETDRAGYTEWGISCYIGAPVFDNDGVYGTFCFYDTQPRSEQFSEWEVTLVDLMSRWVTSELQRKQVTGQLRRQNQRLERFVGVVSHDLRNPLNVLQGRLEFAEETGDPEEFASCYTALERMETLIDDLLTLSSAGADVAGMESVALGSIAERAWRSVATAEATLTVETDRTVTADASRLLQLLENLFRNATEHGGTDVTVTVGPLDDGFYVADTGPGIPTESRDGVFESGYTTNPNGTGFGLAIVDEIVDAHCWSIRVTDGEEGGARFEITDVASA